MKIIPSVILFYACLFLLDSCHPHGSSTAGSADRPRRGDSVVNAGEPSLVARDSAVTPATENYDTLDPVTRSHFQDAQAFLDFIKRPESETGGNFRTWNKHFHVTHIDSLMGFISSDSLEIDDADSGVDGDSEKYTVGFIQKQVSGRKGGAFDMISLVSLQYSLQNPQYAHVRFATDKTDSVANLNVSFSEFVLYFRAEKGSSAYKLYRIESDHISDL